MRTRLALSDVNIVNKGIYRSSVYLTNSGIVIVIILYIAYRVRH